MRFIAILFFTTPSLGLSSDLDNRQHMGISLDWHNEASIQTLDNLVGQLTSVKPNIPCRKANTALESFPKLHAGMYLFEAANTLTSQGFKKSWTTSKGVTFEKQAIADGKCHHHPQSEYELEYYSYDSNTTTVSYSLSNLIQGKFESIEKSIRRPFKKTILK